MNPQIPQEFLHAWSILQLIVVVLSSYTLLVFAVMECTIDRKVKIQGKLPVKRNSEIIQCAYRMNLIQDIRDYPSSICQLFWGLWSGMMFGAFMGIMITVIFVIMILIGFIFGYLPDMKLLDEKDELFHPYQRRGIENEKRWIAPWKFLLAILALYILIRYPQAIWNLTKGSVGSVYGTGENFLQIAIFILAVTFISYIIYQARGVIRKTRSATAGYLRAVKEKACTQIELVE